MPNWCENRVYIEAPPSDIEAILMAVQSDDDKKLLNYLRPEPTYPKENEENLMPNWWNWRVGNWGTKWEVHAEVISHSVADGWVNLAFDSAWSPPIEAFYHWESEGKDRNFNIRFIEWGMAFCGECDSRGVNENFSIPGTVAEVELMIPTEIDEEFGISDMVAQWEEEELESEGA